MPNRICKVEQDLARHLAAEEEHDLYIAAVNECVNELFQLLVEDGEFQMPDHKVVTIQGLLATMLSDNVDDLTALLLEAIHYPDRYGFSLADKLRDLLVGEEGYLESYAIKWVQERKHAQHEP